MNRKPWVGPVPETVSFGSRYQFCAKTSSPATSQCADPWRPNYEACVIDPALRRDPLPTGEARKPVTRGGGYRSMGDRVRSALRAFIDETTTSDMTGFRAVRPVR